MSSLNPAALSVTFQAIAALLLALMLAQLARIFSWRYSRRWAWGWAALFFSLASVRLYMVHLSPVILVSYLVFEWVFLILLWIGCREFVTRGKTDFRFALYAFPFGFALGSVIVRFLPLFNDIFIVQCGIITASAAACFITLGQTPQQRQTAGWETMRLALALIGILYAAYIPLYLVHTHVERLRFLSYSSLMDMVANLFLGFGMILVTAEDANRQLQDTVLELESARSRIEQKLHIDPLTEALNRHAFHWMQRGDEITTDGVLSGVVLMIDIDHLKQINDDFGHSAGDLVIRSAANAIRGLIRADDLLFRWGGDEFVAVLPNLTDAVVGERLRPLEQGLRARVPDGTADIRFTISWGSAEFGAGCSMEQAMQHADTNMYERRVEARTVRARRV